MLDSVLVCGPVLAELLAGTPAEQRDELWLALLDGAIMSARASRSPRPSVARP